LISKFCKQIWGLKGWHFYGRSRAIQKIMGAVVFYAHFHWQCFFVQYAYAEPSPEGC